MPLARKFASNVNYERRAIWFGVIALLACAFVRTGIVAASSSTFARHTLNSTASIDGQLPGHNIVASAVTPAVIIVNNSSDVVANDGLCTLREAITSADQRGDGFPRIVNATVDIGAVESSYSISATAGTPQSATINTAFTTQLQVTVNASGNPASGIPVTFTAPTTGASGTFQGTGTNTATVNTNSSGVATAPAFNANSTAGGPYNVVASLDTGSPSANFSLTNLKGDQTIAFGTLGDRRFGSVLV